MTEKREIKIIKKSDVPTKRIEHHLLMTFRNLRSSALVLARIIAEETGGANLTADVRQYLEEIGRENA